MHRAFFRIIRFARDDHRSRWTVVVEDGIDDAVGGDFNAPTASPNNFAKTRNDGATWDLITGAPAEYRSGAPVYKMSWRS